MFKNYVVTFAVVVQCGASIPAHWFRFFISCKGGDGALLFFRYLPTVDYKGGDGTLLFLKHLGGYKGGDRMLLFLKHLGGYVVKHLGGFVVS
jgi:hypothetical protein